MVVISRTLRKRARNFTRLIRHSAVTPRTGETRKPVLTRNGELALTFIGHSSFFLQTGGKTILLDPNFAQWLFVLKRLRRPGLRIEDLPPIDLVLVTHAHFDHLHRPSLRAIARQTKRLRGRAPSIILPHNVTDLVEDLGFREIIELNHWETSDFDCVEVTLVPSQHWGARIIKDAHRDTAYFKGFREIGQKLHPQIALLPIGAYSPPAFRANHTSPEDAVHAFVDLGSRWMVPMHYGSFRLSHEPMDEPLKLLAKEARRAGIQDRVRVLPEGVTAFF